MRNLYEYCDRIMSKFISLNDFIKYNIEEVGKLLLYLNDDDLYFQIEIYLIEIIN